MKIEKDKELIKEIKTLKKSVKDIKDKIKKIRKVSWANGIRVCSCGNTLRKFTARSSHIYWICDDCYNAYNPDGSFNEYKTPWKEDQDDFAYHESDDEDFEGGLEV